MQNDKIDKEAIISSVIKAKQGDKKAFSFIYSEFFNPIFRFIYFRIGFKAEAEDLAQTVFLKIWLALPGFEVHPHTTTSFGVGVKEKGQFLSWCFTVARNSVIDFYKKKKEILLDNLDNVKLHQISIQGGKDSLTQSIDDKILGERMRRAIALLSGDQQEVIIFKYINGLTNKEIASLLDKNEDNIRQIQFRAIKELKRIMNYE